jgi:hypothetical protein
VRAESILKNIECDCGISVFSFEARLLTGLRP